MIIKKLKGNKIYFPMGTSEWVGISDPIPMMRVTITAGGGMGGSRWERYIEPTSFTDGLNTVTDIITGEEFIINSNYIVEVHSYSLYHCEYTCTNSNFGMVNELCEFYVYTNNGEELVLVNQYKSMEDWTYR